MPASILQGAVNSSDSNLLLNPAEAERRAVEAEERIPELEKAHNELAKAYELLRRSVARLANAADVDAALIEAVRAAAEIVNGLSQQATLALELHRLSIESEKQASLHEQEKPAQQRAEELAKANEALRNCMDELTREQSPEGLLRSFLGQAVKVSGASAGAILRRNRGTEFEFVMVNKDGVTATAEDVIAPESNEEIRRASAEDRQGYFSEIAAGKPRWRRVGEILTDVLPMITRFQQEAGNQMLYDFPYKVGGEVKGYLGLAYIKSTAPSSIVQETISALSTQVGLALEFQRISAQVEQAAIAREQEKAAQQRVAELVKANAALKDSVHAVAQSADFDQSLSEVVLRIADSAGAKEGHLYIYDASANTLRSEFWFQDGVVHWEPHQAAFDAYSTSTLRSCLADLRMIYANCERADDEVRAISRRGVINSNLTHWRKATVAIPVIAGEQALGVIDLGLTGHTSFTEEQQEVLAALSNHAALIMKLRQMERHAREQAVSHEKSRATTAERNRIAREMHDTLLQGFAGVTMQLRAVVKQLRSSDDVLASQALASHIDMALNESVGAMHEARRAVGDMRGEQTKGASLNEMIASVLSAECERHPQVKMHFSCLNDLSDMTEERTENLFRIVREAFRNAVQHASASRISIEIHRLGNQIRAVVSDDGLGFDVENAVRTAGHWGLAGMRERAAALGGSFDIQSKPGQGSQVSVEVPVHG
ncbi:Sensor histidine kinase [Acidisarcina polymorpha]|uniref:histidine kinase n=1 Tax=Acidisarcina polymorpha TaxID=2211140 RepID=A0A2Z5G3Y6_9BACT|nr:GAF domain-containing sensor histidine kinase [Acidisarcina polymorpha]AXC13852.1 Sensor histidine kinase [Acidisarcina polymorpha]